MTYTDLPSVRVERTRAEDDPLVQARDDDPWITTAAKTDHSTFSDNKPVVAEEHDDVRDQLKKLIDNFVAIISVSQPNEELIKNKNAAAAACNTI